MNIRARILGLLAAGMVFSCSLPDSVNQISDKEPPVLEILDNGNSVAVYTLNENKKIEHSRSIGDYDVWTDRQYTFQEDGEVRSIVESYDSSHYENTRMVSQSRSIGRSGKIQSITYSIEERSTVAGRAQSFSSVIVDYVYDESNQLTEIIKMDEYGNTESKVVDIPAEMDSVRGLDFDVTVDEIDGNDIVDSPQSQSGGIENTYFEIGSNIHDYRFMGIPETFSRGQDVTVPITDLPVGSIFIDEGGTARKLVSVSINNEKIVYDTMAPDFNEFLNYVNIPATSYDWNNMDYLVEYVPEGVTITEESADSRFDLEAKTKIEMQIDMTEGNVSGGVELTFEPDVNFNFDFGLVFGKIKRWRLQKGWGKAIVTTTVALKASGDMFLNGTLQKPFLLYPKGFGTDAVKMQFGLFFVPKLAGQVEIGTNFNYTMYFKGGLQWVMGLIFPKKFEVVKEDSDPNTWGYGVNALADVKLDLKLLAIGGEAKLFGINFVKTYPGAGLYANAVGEAEMSATFEGSTPISASGSVEGKGTVGLFMSAIIKLWNDKWEWTLINKRIPLSEWSASKEWTTELTEE